jgi:hypothetical protein
VLTFQHCRLGTMRPTTVVIYVNTSKQCLLSPLAGGDRV